MSACKVINSRARRHGKTRKKGFWAGRDVRGAPLTINMLFLPPSAGLSVSHSVHQSFFTRSGFDASKRNTSKLKVQQGRWVRLHAASSGFLLVCCPKRDKFSETQSAGTTRSSLALLVFSRCFRVHYGHFEVAALFTPNQLSVKIRKILCLKKILTSFMMILTFEYDEHPHTTACSMHSFESHWDP